MANPVHGWNEYVTFDAQTAIATPAFAVAGDSIRVESFDAGPLEAKSTRVARDKTVGRDETNIDWTHGAIGPITWKCKASVYPSGTAGTAPQALTNLFQKAAGFIETITGGTSAAYTLAASTNATANPANILGNSIIRGDRDGTYAEHLVGAIVTQIKFVWGEQDLYMELEGQAIGKSSIGQSALNGAITNIQTTLVCTTGDSYKFIGGSGTTYNNTVNAGNDFYIQIDSECIRVTAINYSTDTWTIARAQAATSGAAHNGGAKIYPYLPASTYQTGFPIPETDGSATRDGGTSFQNILKGSFTVKTGIGFTATDFGQIRKTRVKSDRAHAEFEMDLVFDLANEDFLGRANQFTNLSMIFTNGVVAGNKWKVAAPQAQVEVFPTPFPKDDVVTAKIKGRARGSSGQDTFTITFF